MVAFPFSRGSSQPRIFPICPHCRRILYQLSHKEKACVKFYSWLVTQWGFEPGFSALKVFGFILPNFTAEVIVLQVSKEASRILGLYQFHWVSYFILNSDFFFLFSLMLPWLTKPSSAQSFSQVGHVFVGYRNCVLDGWF